MPTRTSPKRSVPTPPPLELQPPHPLELPPALPEPPQDIELAIRSTTRPMINNNKVKNRVAKPRIGAVDKVRTPGLNQVTMIVASPEPTP